MLKLITPSVRSVPMQRDELGYWKAAVDEVLPGTRYLYGLDGERDRPDPASSSQPDGVHESSMVIDHNGFNWDDTDWRGLRQSDMIMYEIHIGTFTHEGTFEAAVSRLEDLKQTGINTVEIMPVAQFPGSRNWGYDGVYPFAVQNSYGGPEGLRLFVNECHKKDMAVVLDVVYNHLGPEGNYLWDYGPYFTDRYRTPWGQAVNFDGPYSNEVRNYFIQNALYWFELFHIDALRLDAIHGIYDMSAKHFLRELAERTAEFSVKGGRKYYLIAESDLNDVNAAVPTEKGGHGLDALWCDDYHHALHALLTGETKGYYVDFGETWQLVKSLLEGHVFTGQYSEFRKRNHGNSSEALQAERFVVFSQNHDQVGNRLFGERLSGLVSFEAQKLAAGVVLLSPYVPLLFMGEEYGETAPFLYFVSHSDRHLIEGVRNGRKKEFGSFDWEQDPPDPMSIDTFMQSRLDWDKRSRGDHAVLLDLYTELIRLRRATPAFANLDKRCLKVWSPGDGLILMRRWKDGSDVFVVFNFNRTDAKCKQAPPDKDWKKVVDSSDAVWSGPGPLVPDYVNKEEALIIRAESFAVYESAL